MREYIADRSCFCYRFIPFLRPVDILMKKILSVSLAIFFGSFVYLRGQEIDYKPDKLLTQTQLKEDLLILRATLEEAHADLYRHVDSLSYHHYFESLVRSLDRPMKEREFYQFLLPAIQKIKDGHTALYPSYGCWAWTWQQKFLPMHVVVREEKLLVYYDYTPDSLLPRGTEILSINGMDTPACLEMVSGALTTDGDNTAALHQQLGGQFWFWWSILQGAEDEYILRYRRPDEYEFRIDTFPTISADTMALIRENRGYSKRPGRPVSFAYVDSLEAGYLKIDAFTGMKKRSYTRFLDSTFQVLNDAQVPFLILDLRRNGHGQEDFQNLLFSYLFEEEVKKYSSVRLRRRQSRHYKYMEYGLDERWHDWRLSMRAYRKQVDGSFLRKEKYNYGDKPQKVVYGGKLFILVGGRTFSYASDFASLVRELLPEADIVGQITGGAAGIRSGPYYYPIILPNSGIRLRLPRGRYQLNLMDIEPGRLLVPDYHVPLTAEDFTKVKDPVMQKVAELILNEYSRS